MSRIPLVLLPGLLCDAALWRAQLEGLRDVADMQVADLTQADTMADMAANVLGRAPARFALAGLSMGGYLAFELLRQAPTRIARMALLDTSARADTPAPAVMGAVGVVAEMRLSSHTNSTGSR